MGFLTQEVQDKAVYQYFYNEEGNIEKLIDAEQNSTSYVYDAFERLTRTIYADLTVDKVDYDLANLTVTYTDASGNKEREQSDLLGQVTLQEENNKGSFIPLRKLTYDLDGNVLSSQDGNGQITTSSYDALGRLLTVTDPEMRLTGYTYSLAGDLTGITFPDKTTLSKQYDELGRLTRQINEKSQSESYYYDTRSNVIKHTNYAGKTTEYKYNDDNLVTEIKTPSEAITYAYDSVGRRINMNNAQGDTKYSYSPADGSLQTLRYPDGSRIDYIYNNQQRTGYKFTSGTGKAIEVQGKLDEMNRLTEMNILNGGGSTFAGAPSQQMRFEYEANSLLKRQTSSNNVNTTLTYNGYDLTGVNIGGGSTGQQFSYEYDNNKNIIGRTQNGAVDQYSYDSLSRIQSEQSEGKDKSFTYDDKGNRLTGVGNKIVGMENAEYTFDSLDRLTGVKSQGKAKEAIDVSYSYNGDGLLYERMTKDQRIRYYYNEEGKLLAEASVGADKIAQMVYFYVYDLSGRLWARQSKTGSMEYYQFNGHGDVIALTDKDGKELNSYSYDIWGNPTKEKEEAPNLFRYSGEYWDSDTGLQYLRARWYDPNTARFISRDTYEGQIGNPLSLNLYSYVENNPLTNVDPTGHWCESNDGKNSHPGNCSNPNRGIFSPDVNHNREAMKRNGNSIGIYKFDFGDGLHEDNSWTGMVFDTVVTGGVGLGKFAIKGVSKGVKGAYSKASKWLSKGCNCFVAGTEVLTDEGEKPIEEIEVGDKVLSKDDETGEIAYKEVEWLFQREVDETYNITVGSEVITTTDEHPFWIVGKGWVESKNLVVGDVLTTSDGKELAIEKIEVKKEHMTVYNFKVKDFHTYFVSNLGIWTHNACSTPNTTTKWDIKTGADKKIDYKFNGSTVSAYRDPKTGLWWAKDTTGHADSAFKVFKEAKGGKELHWVADADEYGNYIVGKHKSSTGTVIKIK